MERFYGAYFFNSEVLCLPLVIYPSIRVNSKVAASCECSGAKFLMHIAVVPASQSLLDHTCLFQALVGWVLVTAQDWELCHDLPLISSNESVPRSAVWLSGVISV